MISASLLNPYSEHDFKRLLDSLEEDARILSDEFGLDWMEVLGSDDTSFTASEQIVSIARSGVFDQEYYLSRYKDVASSDIHPLQHYVLHGDFEGRWPNAYFNPNSYRSHFKDGELGTVTALYHYTVVGEALGINASHDFESKRYIALHPKLASWLDRPLTHFLCIGRYHGFDIHLRIRLPADQSVQLKAKPFLVRPSISPNNFSVNVIGPVDKVSGLGVSARGYLEGIILSGLDQVGALSQPYFPKQENIPFSEYPIPPFIDRAPINIVHMNGDILPLMIENGGLHLLNGYYNIAVWYWELSVLRPEWHVLMKYFHEFWAPTPFIASTIRGATSKRVTQLPPYLHHLQLIHNNRHNEMCSYPYFIYCFDANSILERKNPMALVKAFQLAFSDRDNNSNLKLYLKITYPDRNIREVAELYQFSAKDPRIKIIDELLSTSELHNLIANAVAYVSPHRSEGLGLTVIEAMAAGVPVVTTSFGGLKSFIDANTAWPVDFENVELKEEYYPYPNGYTWCEPSIPSMAQQMRLLIDNPDIALTRAAKARDNVLNYFCSHHLIEKYRRALASVCEPDY